jgi:outer membrane protein assembly factor BamB
MNLKFKSLRIWPGIVIVVLQWTFRYVLPEIVPSALMYAVFSGIIGGLAVLIWWMFFSKARGIDRWGAPIIIIITFFIVAQFLHKSISTAMQGMMFTIYSLPVVSIAFVAWAVVSERMNLKLRRITMVITIFLSLGIWLVLRTNGMTGQTHQDFAWRWSKTSEEKLLSSSADSGLTTGKATGFENKWPGFRGQKRDGIVNGIRIKTDWTRKPPVELWRRPVGPGCSSFAVSDNYIFTQEQRGDEEIVSCYNLNTGEPVWMHSDSARFWDAHAGAGPRSTPTLCNGRVYTMGATGILNVLDAANGKVIWSRKASKDAGTEDSGWGYTSSPLVIDSVVIVACVGKLMSYNIATGHLLWSGSDGGDSYSSPHLLTIKGVRQVLLMSANGVISVDPGTGAAFWKYDWKSDTRIEQPSMIDNNSLLISQGSGKGIRRISVQYDADKWTIGEQWTSTNLKPNFNDFIVHEGYAYGFDGPSLVCIDLKDGSRKWKGQRYAGEMILLADQDVLLMVTEKGELALTEAKPDQFKELAKIQGIKGKTWNHPALAGDILLIRNAQEMAAFRLSL